jgi:hypothetical protein
MKALVLDVWAKDGAAVEVDGHSVTFVNPRSCLCGTPYDGFVSTQMLEDLRQAREPRLLALLARVEELTLRNGVDAIFSHQPLLPPRFVSERLGGVKRFLGCFDDPFKTFSMTVPSLWAFDGAYYCSPSFDANTTFAEMLERFGMRNHHWFPLSTTAPTAKLVQRVRASWTNRQGRVLYVGKCYGPKVDRLAALKKAGVPLRVFGRDWPLGGWAGYVAPLRGRAYFPMRVAPIEPATLVEEYLAARIGFNLHLGERAETGNARMYETAMHGAMLLCDRAGLDLHAQIYEPDVEAVFYSSTEEAVELARRYLRDQDAAARIAQRGFERAIRDYAPDRCLADLLAWGEGSVSRAFGGEA